MANMEYFIKKVDSSYKELREEYTKLFDDLAAKQAELEALNSKKREYSSEGFVKRSEAINKEIDRIKNKLLQISDECNEEFGTIRKQCQAEFRNRYNAAPSQLDMAAVKLLESGMLTDDELYQFAEDYKANGTMRRYVGKYLQERGEERNNPQMKQIGVSLSNVSQPHLEALDNCIAIACKGLRVSEPNTIPTAESMLNLRRMSDAIDSQLYNNTIRRTINDIGELSSD